MQVCRRCNQEKPAAEFYKNRLMLDGLYSHCKACYQAAASVSLLPVLPLLWSTPKPSVTVYPVAVWGLRDGQNRIQD